MMPTETNRDLRAILAVKRETTVGRDNLERAMLDDDIIRHEPLVQGPEVDWSNEYLRESWIDWRAVAIGIVVAVVGGVFVAGACLLLTGAVFGLNPVEIAADIRSALP